MAGRAIYKAGACSVFLLVVLAVQTLRLGLGFGEDQSPKITKPGQSWAEGQSMMRGLRWADDSSVVASGSSELNGSRAPHSPWLGHGPLVSRKLLRVTSDDDSECRDLHNLPDDQKCAFVEGSTDCVNDEAFLFYNRGMYCAFTARLVPLGCVVYIFWLLFLFVAIATCADDFFCPALVVISKDLRLSANVAGVTFLAFGNGAPDLFAALAALNNPKGDPSLGIGGLLGAGIFVTTIVAGGIAIAKPFKASERPFLRDSIFYLFLVYWTFFALWKGYFHIAEAAGFIVSWVAYVAFVIISGSIYKRQKSKERQQGPADTNIQLTNIEEINLDVNTGALKKTETQLSIDQQVATAYDNKAFDAGGKGDLGRRESLDGYLENKPVVSLSSPGQDANPSVEDAPVNVPANELVDKGDAKEETAEEDDQPPSPLLDLLHHINPLPGDQWQEAAWYLKAFMCIKSPILFLMTLTCPKVDYELPRNNWCRPLQCLSLLITPCLASLAIQQGLTTLGNSSFPAWALLLLIGALLSLVVFFTSNNTHPPKYHDAFAWLGFLIGLVWIFIIANEIVALLECLGVVWRISEAILGVTLLAWGNSTGDFIANYVMARQGFPKMAFAACFGGPFFNLALGFGIPQILSMRRTNEDRKMMSMSGGQLILMVAMLLNIVLTQVYLIAFKFRCGKQYAIFLFVFYIAFIVINILAESDVFMSGWAPK